MAEDKRTHEERRQQVLDDEKKRTEQAETDRKAREEADQKRRKEARDAPLVPDAAGNVMVEVFMGPYRGNRLTMTAADGQAAINNHWARNPGLIEYEHEPLDDAGRVAALDAAIAWAKATWDAANGTGDVGTPVRRDMAAEQSSGYVAKTAPAAKR